MNAAFAVAAIEIVVDAAVAKISFVAFATVDVDLTFLDVVWNWHEFVALCYCLYCSVK